MRETPPAPSSGSAASRAYRDALGRFCTGVAIVTGCERGELVGLAAQSFVSVSLEPPLVAFCPARTSTSWPRIRATGFFCINMLAADQQGLSEGFARRGKVAAAPWTAKITGAPVLTDALAYVECALDAEHAAGDHAIAVGRVRGFGILRGDAPPLLFFGGGYGCAPMGGCAATFD